MSGAPDSGPVVLFDGVCNLCEGVVRFLARRDARGRIRFAALQSPAGQRLLAERGLPVDALDTFVLIEGPHHFLRSDAALRISRYLPWPWSWLAVLAGLPRALRDPVYRFVARHRYRWFGRKPACMLPDASLRERFLD